MKIFFCSKGELFPRLWGCSHTKTTMHANRDTKGDQKGRGATRDFNNFVSRRGNSSICHTKNISTKNQEEVGGFHLDEEIRPLRAPLYFLLFFFIYVRRLACQTEKGVRGGNFYSSFRQPPSALRPNTVRFSRDILKFNDRFSFCLCIPVDCCVWQSTRGGGWRKMIRWDRFPSRLRAYGTL